MMHRDEYSEKIAEDTLKLGLKKGGIVLVHSSLKSLGPVPGGAETVINGLLSALGPDGTLLIPALSYMYVNEENPVFDVRSTPSNIGAIPEFFRKMEGVLRSFNPTHSVCGIGKHAREILGQHTADDTPCGEHSPFRLLDKYEGQLLFIGCGLKPNTSMHAVEEVIGPDYLFGKTIQYEMIDSSGQKSYKRCRRHNFSNWEQRYDRIEQIMEPGELKRGNILKAATYLLDAPALWERAVQVLRREPHYFVDEC